MKLLIIDDDALVCASLKTILETDPQVKVVGTGGSGREAVSLYRRLRPDVLLMDIRMDGLTGLEAGELILREAPEAKILFLTTFSDDEYIIKALKLGAKGYLIKQNFESILPALHAVESGQSVFGSEIVTKLPELMQSGDKFDFAARGVSPRELDVISLVAKGLSNKEIAEALFLSEGTVRNYLSAVLDKLELRDRTQLAVFYFNHQPQGSVGRAFPLGRKKRQSTPAWMPASSVQFQLWRYFDTLYFHKEASVPSKIRYKKQAEKFSACFYTSHTIFLFTGSLSTVFSRSGAHLLGSDK